MSRLVGFIFSVGGLVAAVLAAAAACWLRPRSAAARRFLVGVAAVYTLASIYAVPFTIARALSAGYQRFDRNDLPADKTALVVLGAGTNPVQGWDERLYPLSVPAAARVLEAWRVFQGVSPVWIISSGGVRKANEDVQPSSVNMRDALVRLGVPASRVVLESASLDTHDEAVFIAAMLRTLHVDHVVVVTSDIHMRRSIGAFRAQGVNAMPAIAPDSRRWNRWTLWVLPTANGLEFSRQVIHEVLAIPYYWARGWWRA